MKPHSKLPFKADVMEYTPEGSLQLFDQESELIGDIEYASDAEYIVYAANNFQEAIELLEWNLRFTKAIIQRVDNGYIWREASEIEKYVGEFLNKIK